MITATNVSKRFGDVQAVECITSTINSGSIYGLIGSNGAGKSTFMRMMAGVLKPDSGKVCLDGSVIFENEELKNRIFYISDEQHFLANTSADEGKNFYRMFYPKFDEMRYNHLIKSFSLDKDRKIKNYSKGMKKQLSVIYALCSGADYLLCDETFDGLDPVARQSIKSLLASDVIDRNLTPILASHNLRELEDICDHVGLMHRGGILFSQELDNLKLGIHKFQVIFKDPADLDNFTPVSKTNTGSMVTLVLKGDKNTLLNQIKEYSPIFVEALPLTLEEIFITETEAIGYDIKKFLF